MKIFHLLMDKDGSGNRDDQKMQRQSVLSGIKALCLFLWVPLDLEPFREQQICSTLNPGAGSPVVQRHRLRLPASDRAIQKLELVS